MRMLKSLNPLFSISTLLAYGNAVTATPDHLNYRKITGYEPPQTANVTTLLDLINSRSDLSTLARKITEVGGLAEAFNTEVNWKFTFFAPNNDAFASHTGSYFNTFEGSPKGKWWLGNTLLHHYVPNTELPSSIFNATYQRFQTGSYLFVGSQVVDGDLVLNKVSTVMESDIPVTSGVVHIIDHILDPSAQVFETDLAQVSQTFIAGSCSNLELSYC
ncbi:FAS1 domain-containing protein [Penicillium herquei]|nr:FAS1 domain-containing protein [Penicillium herquei]